MPDHPERARNVIAERFRLVLLLIALAAVAWPLMMLLHEVGHLLAAWLTGGSVGRLVWHPLVFSRTEVFPNPHPLVVVWAGPVVGCLLPLGAERLMAWRWPNVAYLGQAVAGFCLIANGAYIGLGWIDDVGDAGDMLFYGTPAWVMVAFGLVAVVAGFYLWHLASGRRPGPRKVVARHVIVVVALAMVVNAVGLLFGDAGH
ncbi:MAG: hypothetical protein AAF586_09905 [Planctomycetota bacterium]